jgi:hypothetical protein
MLGAVSKAAPRSQPTRSRRRRDGAGECAWDAGCSNVERDVVALQREIDRSAWRCVVPGCCERPWRRRGSVDDHASGGQARRGRRTAQPPTNTHRCSCCWAHPGSPLLPSAGRILPASGRRRRGVLRSAKPRARRAPASGETPSTADFGSSQATEGSSRMGWPHPAAWPRLPPGPCCVQAGPGYAGSTKSRRAPHDWFEMPARRAEHPLPAARSAGTSSSFGCPRGPSIHACHGCPPSRSSASQTCNGGREIAALAVQPSPGRLDTGC